MEAAVRTAAGVKAAVAAIDGGTFDTADALLKKVGMTLVSTVGGASGPLYGTFFLRCGSALADVSDIDAAAFGAALRAVPAPVDHASQDGLRRGVTKELARSVLRRLG